MNKIFEYLTSKSPSKTRRQINFVGFSSAAHGTRSVTMPEKNIDSPKIYFAPNISANLPPGIYVCTNNQ